MDVSQLHAPLLLLDPPPDLAGLLYQANVPVIVAANNDEFVALADQMHPLLALVQASAVNFWACLRQIDVPPPVLVLLDSPDISIDALLAEGAADYLPLPLTRAALLHRLERLLSLTYSESALKAHERRWQQMFHDNQAIKLLTDPLTGKIIDANRAACHFYGYPLEALREKTLNDLDITPAGNADIPPGRTLFGFRHITANGQAREVKMFSSVIHEGDRRLLFSIIFDNTKRVAAETAEYSQRALAEALRDTASALSSTLDQDRVLDLILLHVSKVVPGDAANIMLIRHGSTHIVRHRGYDLQGQGDIAEVHFNVQDIAVYHWMLKHERPLVIPDVSQFEGWQPIELSSWIQSICAAPIRIGKQVIGFLNVDSATPDHFSEHDGYRLQAFADQAAIAIRNAGLYNRVRRQAAELERRIRERTAELEAERGQLHAILEGMNEGVIYTDLSDARHVRYINNALALMTGYSADEWREQSLWLLKPDDESEQGFHERIQRAFKHVVTQHVWHGEIRVPRKDGSTFDAFETTTPVHGADGALIGLVTVIRDISQQKALAQQRTRFVAHASHELRTPITNLKTRLYLMRKQPERLDEHLRVMEEVTERMRRLAEDLLAMSRFERGTIELRRTEAVLQAMIESVVNLQFPELERKHLNLSVDIPDEPMLVFADAERVNQVITNLLVNAINYTPAGGSICVRAVIHDSHHARVEVEDTGIGIAPEHLPHIFQPFYRVTSQVQGTGLGLSIAREIVELHDGTINAVSTLGVGSCFSFLLPLAANTL
jgi:PAS domain S-box-containing protein